jgi:hypothetical protein
LLVLEGSEVIKVTPGPQLYDGRRNHACVFNPQTGLVLVVGGSENETSSELLDTINAGFNYWVTGPNIANSLEHPQLVYQ